MDYTEVSSLVLGRSDEVKPSQKKSGAEKGAQKSTAKNAVAPQARPFVRREEEIQIPDNPVFLKIRKTLQQTDPIRWRRGGEDLNTQLKHPKALDTWDQAFVLDIKDGTLVLRCMTPVKSEYFGGGFTITPVGADQCFVELRGKGWNIRELVDPYYRNASRKDKKLEVLAEGTMALILFKEVRQIVESHNSACRKGFESECFDLMNRLLELVKASKSESWEKIESQPDIVRYASTVEGMQVDIACSKHEEKETFHLKFGKNGMYKTMNSSAIEEMFAAIEDLGRNARLETLSKMLEGIDF